VQSTKGKAFDGVNRESGWVGEVQSTKGKAFDEVNPALPAGRRETGGSAQTMREVKEPVRDGRNSRTNGAPQSPFCGLAFLNTFAG